MYKSSAPRDTAPARIQARNARRAAGSSVTAASLVVYENLSPTLSRIPQIPFADWALDAHSDFAAMYLTRFVIPEGVHNASRPAASPALATVAA